MKVLPATLLGVLCLSCANDAALARSASSIAPKHTLEGQELEAPQLDAPSGSVMQPQLSSVAHVSASAQTTLDVATSASAATNAYSGTAEALSYHEVLNQGGLSGLLGALDDIVAVELVDFQVQAPPHTLSDAERTKLLGIVARCALIDAHSVTHPPWAAAFLFHTQNNGTYALKLVGSESLRLDPGNEQQRFVGDASQWNETRAPEMVMRDGAAWVWQYLEARLGKTRSKEYTVPNVPLELRRPPTPPGQ